MSDGASHGSMQGRSGAPPATLWAERPLIAPAPEAPHWREADRTRLSCGSLRSGLEPRLAAELAEAHALSIRRIARAALAAKERGDHAEAARLASAAARLCGEIRGLWPPSAVEARGG